MAGILEVAKEVRLHPVKCPHCGRNVSTAGLIRAMFGRLVERAAGGERIEVTGFGCFETREHRGGTAVSKVDRIGHGIIEYAETLVLRFRASRVVKARLREIHTSEKGNT